MLSKKREKCKSLRSANATFQHCSSKLNSIFFPSTHIYSADTEDNAAEELPATSKVCLYVTVL